MSNNTVRHIIKIKPYTNVFSWYTALFPMSFLCHTCNTWKLNSIEDFYFQLLIFSQKALCEGVTRSWSEKIEHWKLKSSIEFNFQVWHYRIVHRLFQLREKNLRSLSVFALNIEKAAVKCCWIAMEFFELRSIFPNQTETWWLSR